MFNPFPVPEKLQNRITAVSDNRQPGDGVDIDAPLFVSIYRTELEQWVRARREEAEQQAQVNDCPE